MPLRTAFPFLATGWALLWVALSIAEDGFKFGPHEVGVLLMIPLTGWMFGWLRTNTLMSMETDMDIIRSALGVLPVVIIGLLPAISEYYRHLAGGAAHWSLVTEALKAACFWLPWLLFFMTRTSAGRAMEVSRAPVLKPAIVQVPPRLRASVIVQVGDMLRPLPWDAVLWLEADDNYVRVHTQDRDYFVRRTLRDLLAEAGGRFARIHKSRAVNLAEIATLRPLTNGDGEVRLRSGQTLRMSRRFRRDLAALLKP